MYVKAINGAVESYPYSIGQLRKDNPNVSFPKQPTNELLAEWNVYPVEPVGAPSVDHTQDITQGPPVYDNGWRQTWIVTPASPEEIAQRTQAQGDNVRAERHDYLAESDWTQISDSPLSNTQKTAWATYRQALRDITTQAGFPWDVEWPVAP